MGIGETIKGAAKNVAGEITDNDELKAEGEAQQQKGEDELQADKAQAEAKAHEEKAEALDKQRQGLEN